jgi:hypothetical protein
MTRTRINTLLALLLSGFGLFVHGFSLISQHGSRSLRPFQRAVALDATNKRSMAEFEMTLSILCIGAALFCNPAASTASIADSSTVIMPSMSFTSSSTSSSFILGEEIKILDMSLPSYGAISDPKQADLDSLKKDLPKNVPALISKKESSTAATKASSKKAKKVVIKKEEEDDEKTKNLKILDMTLPSYTDSTVGKGKDAFLI